MDESARAGAGPRAFGPLAPGWVPVKDQASGDTYYWNQLTNDTTWDRPVAEEPPPAPEGLPHVCRASTNRSVVVAPGAAAAAAARTRSSASLSRQSSPKCSASASHCSTSSSGILSPIRDGPGPACAAATPPPFTALPPAATPTSAASTSSRASVETPASASASSRSAIRDGANVSSSTGRRSLDKADGARSGEREPAAAASSSRPHSRAVVDTGWTEQAADADAAAETRADAHLLAKAGREQPRAQPAETAQPRAARCEAPSAGASASSSGRASGASQATSSAAAAADEPAPGAGWRARLGALCAESAAASRASGGLAASRASTGLASLVAQMGSRGAGFVQGRADAAASAPAAAATTAGQAFGLAQLLRKPAAGAGAADAAAGRRAATPGDAEATGAGAAGDARPARSMLALLAGLDRRLLLRALGLLGCLAFLLVLALSAAGAAAGGRGARGAMAASPPRVLAVGMHTASLEWAQQPPRGTYAVAYELEVHHGGKGGGPLATYEGLADARELSGLPESAVLCARVRLALRAEVSGEAVRSLWSACAVLHTSARSAPAPPVLELEGTSVTSLAVRWPPPAPNGGAVSRVQVGRSEWQLALVHACEWTGPTCALGCGGDGARDPAARTQNATRLSAVWEHCDGANSVGCCGPFCWCYDRHCCTPSTELSERLDVVVLELPATDAAGRAELDVRDAAAARALSVRARAFNALGWSAWGPALRVQTDAAGATPPGPMAPPAFRTAPTAVRLSWLAPAPNGAALLGFDVRLRAPAGGARAPLDALTSVGNVSSALLEQLEPSTAYLVSVRARNSRGAGAWSEPVALTTGEMQPPPPPAQLAVGSRYSDALQLSWAAVHAETATVVGYELQWATASSAREPAWRSGCSIGALDATVDALDELARDASGALRDALRSPSCALSALPIRTSVKLRARTRSLAGWGPWGAGVPSETLELKACGSHVDQQRVWSAAYGKELQTCSADCWGQPPCVTHCLQAIDLSVGCARCFGAAIACTKSVCHSSCSWSPVSTDCRECAAQRCWPTLSTCAGSPLPAGVL